MTGEVVDVHSHYVGADLLEWIESDAWEHEVGIVHESGVTRVSVGGKLSGLPVIQPLVDVEQRLAWMDAAGIDIQFVSPWMDLAGYELSDASGVWLAQVQNDSTTALVRKRPDRFIAVAAVPLQSPQLAARELRRAVVDGHRAVQIGARVGEAGLDDPRLDVFWQTAEDLGIPIIVHPAELDVPERSRRLFLHILVGNPAETTFAAAALMLGGVLEKYPGLRIILVHGGGFVPYQLGRIDRGFAAAPPRMRSRGKRSPRELLEQIYFDTVLHDTDALAYLVNVVGAGNIVLGSDYPFPMKVDDPLRALGELGLADNEYNAILSAQSLVKPNSSEDERMLRHHE